MVVIIKDDIDMNIFTLSDYFENYDNKYVCLPNKILINYEINLILIKKFIEKNKDIHHQQDEKLFIIICSGILNIVKLLIEHEANIYAQDDEALIKSIKCKKYNILELLLKNGADATKIEF